ncbi:MAG: hypothetical protein HY067_20150 [Betaproteobacteria bacterium]|nr:hypothetical protein [Betaproteobacteria bacterium]
MGKPLRALLVVRELKRGGFDVTFEYALNHLLDHELDLSGLDERFCNDATGAPA